MYGFDTTHQRFRVLYVHARRGRSWGLLGLSDSYLRCVR
jgi:hypothetical protein